MNRDSYDLMLGTNGGVIVSDTTLHAGPFAGMKAITDVVIASATLAKITGTIAGITVKAGDFLPLTTCTAITLQSGTALFINSVPL